MTRTLPRFRTGDLVEVRSRQEILATLDEHGCVDEMPFMPEMLQFCGQRFRVSAVAHKTCETARRTWKNRRLRTTVHLAGVRCDGSGHGGCQADCNVFWKDVWLKPAGDRGGRSAVPTPAQTKAVPRGCTDIELVANTRLTGAEENGPRYSCQATKLYDATEPLAWWDVRQYVRDVITGNHSPGRVVRVIWLATLRWLLFRLPIGWRLFKSFHDWMHELLTGRSAPYLHGKIKRGMPTPVGRLDLKPGELVRVKPQSKIEETVDETGRNRGLSFDREEMAPYCGGIFKVRSSVTRIIDESTGRMRHMKQPCIILEGVVCKAEYARCRLNCPRELPPYWRELWLERVDVTSPAAALEPGKGPLTAFGTGGARSNKAWSEGGDPPGKFHTSVRS
jgi:hypothetical protein